MDYKKLDLPNTNYPSKEQLKAFETAFNAFLETNPQENENHQNDAFNDLLKGVFKYKVKPTKKIDSAILNDNDKVEVIIEFKALKNPNEFIKKGDLNVKAFHESLFYYLIERKEGNNNLKHLILATIKELYIIDANEFEVFNKDKEIENAFKNCHDRKGNDTRTEAFYDVCQKRLNELDRSLKYHHIPLKKENLALIYQALSPNFLLKIPKYSDANTLNKDFYEELLYILGLEEQNEKGKILIKPSRTQNSLSYALKEQYKNLDDEEVMALLIAWNNRILFLRLLESLLISFEHFEKEKPFLTIGNFKDFNALNTLFFEVLAKKNSERLPEIKQDKILEKIPYLNSSLFDKTPLELKGHEIKLLDNKKLEIYKNSVLKKDNPKQEPLPLLKYLFEFLRIYDFTTTPKDIKDNQNKSESSLINPSVLGLVFEKLNGYKEGSFYTPSFITSYMCKESITPIVLDKFNATYQWDCENLEALREKIDRNFSSNEKAKEYLNTLLTLRICDPAVGSGHFLVSALNEMVLIAYKLGLIASLYRHDLRLENDEIIIHTPEDKVFKYTIPHSENDPHHQIQKELFELKKDIIENCLFGVDINPNSCEITKLRLWIELLKYSYYIFEKGKNTNALETLPNIDINIKCANSLIFNFPLNSKLTIGQTLEFSKNLKAEIKEYKNSVMLYKEGLGEKAKILQNIAKLKSLIINYFIEQHQAKRHLKESLKAFISEYGDGIFDIGTAFGMEMLKIARHKDNNYKFVPTLTKKQPSPIGVEANRLLIKIKECYETLENLKNSNAFEWRFEFPEVLDDEGDFLGFDCIIGNPPYIRQEHIKDLKPLLQKQYQDFYNSTADIYTYFFALAFNLLKEKGFSAFITSNKYARAKYGAKLRELLLKKTTLVSYMELNALKVFESAAVDTSIIHFIKQAPLKESVFKYYEPTENDKENLKNTPSLLMRQNALSTESFIFANTTLLDLRDKMEKSGTPLKDWGIQIYRGILTGCNEAFIIPTEKRDEILKNCDDAQKDEKGMSERERTIELIKPILRGKDIKRYSYEWAHLWVINTHNGYTSDLKFKIPPIDIEKYPAIKAHLDSHYDAIVTRSDQGDTPYHLRNCAYLEDFEKEKIVYPCIMAKEPCFVYEEKGFYAPAPANIITGDKIEIKYLTALLNSKCIYFAMRKFYMGGGIEGELKTNNLEKIPIPKITEKNQELAQKITDCAERILKLKAKDPKANTQELEKEIDALVYQLYNLTDEEIKIIEDGQ
ncbi:class I SAM-dependent DNA methyltransferase [Helicobacter pylori]|uniref:class I SAM-dependent DNA methyltransferase n=1 Tax=Helicobacter pylori TaxID=210 RepID=UPI00123B3C45|nr:class I SAM-dependent DNA methyltransferase [Helicobacter pylori]KAA6495753.1 class I SAM-dependent DNA methyltransferase [Helicobacter pylori]KAA6503695.1 class I SAM-dependent DNA methyltransferase [Helicobacter pylori]